TNAKAAASPASCTWYAKAMPLICLDILPPAKSTIPYRSAELSAKIVPNEIMLSFTGCPASPWDAAPQVNNGCLLRQRDPRHTTCAQVCYHLTDERLARTPRYSSSAYG